MNLPGGWELILVVIVIMVLFGYKKLPDATRSLGRSMRIFKAETKGLRSDDHSTSDSARDDRARDEAAATQAALPPAQAAPPVPPAPPAAPVTDAGSHPAAHPAAEPARGAEHPRP